MYFIHRVPGDPPQHCVMRGSWMPLSSFCLFFFLLHPKNLVCGRRHVADLGGSLSPFQHFPLYCFHLACSVSENCWETAVQTQRAVGAGEGAWLRKYTGAWKPPRCLLNSQGSLCPPCRISTQDHACFLGYGEKCMNKRVREAFRPWWAPKKTVQQVKEQYVMSIVTHNYTYTHTHTQLPPIYLQILSSLLSSEILSS